MTQPAQAAAAALEKLWSEVLDAQPALALLGPDAQLRKRLAEKIAEGQARGLEGIEELCRYGKAAIPSRPNAYDRAVSRQRPVVQQDS